MIINTRLIFLTVFSFIPSFFWLVCYYFYFPRRTTPKFFLTILFFGGMAAAVSGFFIHRNILGLLPGFVFDTFQKYLSGFPSFRISEIAIMFLLMFVWVAPVEELLKFFVIKLAIARKPGNLDQIIDGIKFGIVVGLGFAVVENAIYFYQPFMERDSGVFLKLFFTRFLISTLAHSLYTGILGYYIGLSRLYRLHSRYLLRKGIFMAVVMHGIFNFFLLMDLRFFSISALIILLWFMIRWGRDRESLESIINAHKYQNIFMPVLSGKKELESFLFRHRIKHDVIRKLNLCPFCFTRKKAGQDICPHCKAKQPAQS